MTYKAFTFARFANEQIVENTSADYIDIIPAGFKNSIQWNYGHILVIAEHVLSHAPAYQKTVPKAFYHPFAKGSSPKQWTDQVPSISELQKTSMAQQQAIHTLINTEGGAGPTTAFTLYNQSFQTVDELLSFIAFHEGMHYRTLLHYNTVFNKQ
ncbi:DinB family protein [Shouchella patagoniensis]|uniref:DinB family protein n=1 Tax=Shouchella patagoniensis TaxID=228576 RepID=UPI000994E2AE|nr:DinB family protein [Shouchella patagoniensis]